MIHMINARTGTDMYVSEDRIEEYLAAGHKLAASPPAEKQEKEPVKKTVSRKRKE